MKRICKKLLFLPAGETGITYQGMIFFTYEFHLTINR